MLSSIGARIGEPIGCLIAGLMRSPDPACLVEFLGLFLNVRKPNHGCTLLRKIDRRNSNSALQFGASFLVFS